jgi:hypothetical protein
VNIRDIAEAAAIWLTEEGHTGKTYDLVSSEMFRGPNAAAAWSRLLGKQIAYAGHPDFDSFEAQLREKESPSWLAYDIRVMYQGFIQLGFSNTEDRAARFAALRGRQPRTYSSVAEELAKEWRLQRKPQLSWITTRLGRRTSCVNTRLQLRKEIGSESRI